MESTLDKALSPYEKILQAQERFRRMLGVKEVEKPTYERYITGPVERFDRTKNAFLTLMPNNPYGEEFRETFIKHTGVPHFAIPVDHAEMEISDRIGASLSSGVMRLCIEYHPEPRPVTKPEGRVEVNDPAAMSAMSRLIKKAALLYGADMVRITRVDPRWVYKDVDIPHEYAIVVAVSHKTNLLKTAPSHYSGLGSADSYSRLKFITTQLTDFICTMGYDAMYRETLGPNLELNMVPLAMDAGLGEFARNGRVLSPELGINMRLKAVTTSLPLERDKPISFGIHEFCMACENCAIFCPAGAIPKGEPTSEPPTIHSNPGFKKWYIKADKCLMFWASNRHKWRSCGGRCITVCPWTKPVVWWHNLVRYTAIHGPHKIKQMLALADIAVYRHKKSLNS